MLEMWFQCCGATGSLKQFGPLLIYQELRDAMLVHLPRTILASLSFVSHGRELPYHHGVLVVLCWWIGNIDQ
jgi:hypothetical protein